MLMGSLDKKMPDKNDFSESRDFLLRSETQDKSYSFLLASFLKDKILSLGWPTVRYIETWISEINDGMNPSQGLNAPIFSKVLNIQNWFKKLTDLNPFAESLPP